jgi:hypothetical protein
LLCGHTALEYQAKIAGYAVHAVQSEAEETDAFNLYHAARLLPNSKRALYEFPAAP